VLLLVGEQELLVLQTDVNAPLEDRMWQAELIEGSLDRFLGYRMVKAVRVPRLGEEHDIWLTSKQAGRLIFDIGRTAGRRGYFRQSYG